MKIDSKIYYINPLIVTTLSHLLNQNKPLSFEKKPALKLESGKLTSFEINFGKPFEVWHTENNGKKITKAIIPVRHDSIDKILWLNKNNELYPELIHAGRTGQTKFTVFTSGTQAETRYALVKE